MWHFLFGLRQGETTQQKKKKKRHSRGKLSLTSLAQPDCCYEYEGCSDRFGAWDECLSALSGTPSQAFPTSLGAGGEGGRRGWGERWAPRSTAILWAVAGKGYGPLFSPSPPVVTNPTEREREGEGWTERGRDTQRQMCGQRIGDWWVRGQLTCGGRGTRCQVITKRHKAERSDGQKETLLLNSVVGETCLLWSRRDSN